MLDWRGSGLVVDAPANNASLRDQPHIYNFNRAAAEDLPAAIEKMRQAGVNGPVSLLGHCMGGAVAAEAIALGHLENADVDRVVLIALGLFYEAPIDSRLKSEERILERLTQAREHCVVAIDPRVVAIDPRIGDDDRSEDGWPQELKNLYDAWPGALRSHAEESNPAGALCNRLSFMLQIPYHHKNLLEVIHDQANPELLNQFGAIPLRMYLHAAEDLRRGHATFFKKRDRPPATRTSSQTELAKGSAS